MSTFARADGRALPHQRPAHGTIRGPRVQRCETLSEPSRSRPPPPVTLGLVQMHCVESKEANVEKALGRIAEAADAGAEVICLPELFAGLYPCQSEDHRQFAAAEPIPGPPATPWPRPPRAWRGRRRLAVRAACPGPVPQHGGGASTPTAAWRACTARCTSPTTRCTTRSSTSRPATWASRSFATRFGRIGACVCWDQWYPEAARLTALTGAEMIFYPTAIGWHAERKGRNTAPASTRPGRR